ncbi:MAG: hypothetical protein ACLQQ4_14560 [Bacteroidia bacterium]
MKEKRIKIRPGYLMVCMAAILACGCNLFTPTISSYDQYAYTQTTSLKVDALNLMDSAISDYQSHIKLIMIVNTNVQKLCEYEKNLPKNDITLKQWQILTDTTGHLFGGFMLRWKNEKKLSKGFINDEKNLVSNAFDQIAELESKKIKSPTTNN